MTKGRDSRWPAEPCEQDRRGEHIILPVEYADRMPRTSHVLWFAAIQLMVGAALAGLYSLMYYAKLAHASDVYRDDVGTAQTLLESHGVFDADKAAVALGLPAYSGNSPEQRAEFEKKVQSRTFRFLTDAVAARVENSWAGTASNFSFVAAWFAATSALVGWQAVRTKRLEGVAAQAFTECARSA